MKVKLVKEVEVDQKLIPIHSIIEVEDLYGQTLIDDKSGIKYDEASEQVDIKQQIREITMADEVKVENKVQPKSFVDGIKGLVTGSVKEITLKVGSGQNENTAADGGNLVYQGMDELQGALLAESIIYPKVRKITSFGPNEYGRFIPYRDESTQNTTSAPRTYAVGDGAAKTATKMAFNRHDLKLGTDSAVVYLTEEILSDVGYLAQYVIEAMTGKLGWMQDYNILKSTYAAGSQGCIGVFDGGAANFYVEPVAHAATYTGAIINGIIGGVDPRLRNGAEWYMSNSMHSTLMGQLGSGTTVSTQPLFTNNGTVLAGYPVNVMTQMSAFGSAGDILFGNFAKGYTVAQKGEVTLAKSADYAFLTDEVVLRATLRYMGAPTYRRYAGVDAVNVAAFSSTSGTV